MLHLKRWTDAKELLIKASSHHYRRREEVPFFQWRETPENKLDEKQTAQLLVWFLSDIDPWDDVRKEIGR